MKQTNSKLKRVALLGAMYQEIESYKTHIVEGKWNDIEICVETTGVGKSAAAATTQRIISEFNPDAIILTGVAGALDENLNIGDIGVGVAAIDADLDVRSWDNPYKKGEVPFSHERVYFSDHQLVELASQAPLQKKLFNAYIASGSKFLDVQGKYKFKQNGFFDLEAEINEIKSLPNLYEMEGSAVLQTANTNNVPCLVVRVVSDTTGGDSTKDFNAFIERAIDDYVIIVDYVLKNYKK